jgi:hypothetical protein
MGGYLIELKEIRCEGYLPTVRLSKQIEDCKFEKSCWKLN